MIESIIDRFTSKMSIENSFDAENLTLTTTVKYGNSDVHKHVLCLEEMYAAFDARSKKDT